MKRIANLFVTAYLLLLFVVYPFYMKNGYVEIGQAKADFWMKISIGASVILIILWLLEVLWQICFKRKASLLKEELLSYSKTDLFVALFGVTLFVSYFLSIDRKEALWGTEGWNMGVICYALLCLLYFLISRLWIPEHALVAVMLGVSGIIFWLGIMDRFSLYVIPLKIRDPGFLSTLGNINWFTGYLVVFVSVSAGLFLLTEKKWMNFLAGIVTMIGFLAGFCQGSSSVFLFFSCLFLVLFYMVLEDRSKNWRFLILWGSWCMAAQGIRLLRWLLPDGYQYETENLCGYFTQGNLTIYLLVIGGLFFWILKMGVEKYPVCSQYLRKGMRIGAVLFLFLFVWISLQKSGMLEDLLGKGEGNSSIWKADVSWGNGRGMTYHVGFGLLRTMNGKQRLFGVGPDCFSVYAYSIPEVAEELYGYFGNDRLTNAHNELLTMLINHGLIGTVCYLGIFLTYLWTSFHRKRNPYSMSVAVAVICYLVHNLVSFANVLNLPFLIILLAMGEKCCKMITIQGHAKQRVCGCDSEQTVK